MILTEKMIEALEILESAGDDVVAQGRETDPLARVIFHPTAARLILHHLAEVDGEDRYHRPALKITADGLAVLEATRAMRAATTTTTTTTTKETPA